MDDDNKYYLPKPEDLKNYVVQARPQVTAPVPPPQVTAPVPPAASSQDQAYHTYSQTHYQQHQPHHGYQHQMASSSSQWPPPAYQHQGPLPIQPTPYYATHMSTPQARPTSSDHRGPLSLSSITTPNFLSSPTSAGSENTPKSHRGKHMMQRNIQQEGEENREPA